MKCNQWTLGLAALGAISLASVAQAEEAKMSSVQTALSSTTLSGYVDTSAQWNIGKGDVGAPKYGFGGAGKADGFNLNVVDLNLEKDADAAEAWGAGYKVELWLGPDAVALGTQSSGVANDFAVKNAYVDLKAPVGTGLDVKIGVFDTPIGYEVADSINNPNFTRSYGFTVEPTTHTGILASYTVIEWLSVSAGVADTYGPVINARATDPVAGGGTTTREAYKTYMGSFTLTGSTNWGWFGGSTLSGCVINGFNAGSPAGAGGDQTSLYLGASMNTPCKDLKLGAAFDYVSVGKQGRTGGAGGYQEVYGLYATYQATEKLGFDARAEYFQQSKGVSGVGLPSKVVELTLTAQYDLWKNVMSRVEARWDHQTGDLGANNSGAAYGDPAAGSGFNNSYELLANIAYKF